MCEHVGVAQANSGGASSAWKRKRSKAVGQKITESRKMQKKTEDGCDILFMASDSLVQSLQQFSTIAHNTVMSSHFYQNSMFFTLNIQICSILRYM